jgi:2-polyprenyl-3-methyl-5-hydroxy-6-metoxy-1,4-benzoquinol methylase
MPIDPKAIDGRKQAGRFSQVSYEGFRRMATNPCLSANEKIGMSDVLRTAFDANILKDMVDKVPTLGNTGKNVVDIGCGCGTLTLRLIEYCGAMQHNLTLVDSPEMLEQLPDVPHVRKVAGRFPENSTIIEETIPNGADVVIVYGVLSVVFIEANPFLFVDQAASLLRAEGRLLIGDIPNLSKLRRFLVTDTGARYHKQYMRSDKPPVVGAFDGPGQGIDDGVVLGIIGRMRRSGYDAYVLPQADSLPLSNRREDILIVRP